MVADGIKRVIDMGCAGETSPADAAGEIKVFVAFGKGEIFP